MITDYTPSPDAFYCSRRNHVTQRVVMIKYFCLQKNNNSVDVYKGETTLLLL